jgi:two-component system cell cycle response regulator
VEQAEDTVRELEPERQRDLLEQLQRLMGSLESGGAALPAELERLESSHGEAVYRELIFLLCHLRFEVREARRCWRDILAHHDDMQRRLGASLDLRVALASYFLQVNRQLENPKIIELKLFEATQASAYRDELTGLYNYRFFSEFLRREVLRAGRTDAPLSLVMIDVDDFKAYNDRCGHETGNVALRQVARLLADTLHNADMAARYGGEEFALILPSTPKQEAQEVAERIRGAIELHGFPEQSAQPGGTLTVSMGIATFPGDARDTGGLIRCADRAMYAAKLDGKDRVQLFGDCSRSYRRVAADVAGSVRLIGSDALPMTCVSLSEGGLSFLASCSVAPGTFMEITLEPQGSDDPIALVSRVVQIAPADCGGYLIGSRILNMETSDRKRLARYISQGRPRGSGDPSPTP